LSVVGYIHTQYHSPLYAAYTTPEKPVANEK